LLFCAFTHATISGGYQEGTTQSTLSPTPQDGRQTISANFGYSSKDYESTTRAGIGLASKDAEIVHKDINVKPISVKAQYDSEDGFVKPVEDFKQGGKDHLMAWEGVSRSVQDIATGVENLTGANLSEFKEGVDTGARKISGFAQSTAIAGTQLLTGEEVGSIAEGASATQKVKQVRENGDLTYALNNSTDLDANEYEQAVDGSIKVITDGKGEGKIYNEDTAGGNINVYSKGMAYQDKEVYINTDQTDISDVGENVEVIFHEGDHVNKKGEKEADALIYGKVASSDWQYRNFVEGSVTGGQNGVSIEQWRNTQNATNPQAFADVSHIKSGDAEHYWWLAPAAVQPAKEGVKRILIPAAKWAGKKVVQGTKWAYNKVVGGGGKNVDDVLKNAKRGKKTKEKSKIFEKSGGFDQAKKDFYSLKPVNLSLISCIKVSS
jgi:hypothetical protein